MDCTHGDYKLDGGGIWRCSFCRVQARRLATGHFAPNTRVTVGVANLELNAECLRMIQSLVSGAPAVNVYDYIRGAAVYVARENGQLVIKAAR